MGCPAGETRSAHAPLAGVMRAQFVLGVLVGAIAYTLAGKGAAAAAAFGVLVAVANTLAMSRRLGAGRDRGTREQRNAEQELRSFIRSSVERYLLVAALFALAMGAMGLAASWLLLGFVLAQAGWIAAAIARKPDF